MTKSGDKPAFRRLSTEVVPQNYGISLNVDLKNFKFSGTEIISVQVKAPVKSITLHAVALDVKSARFDGANATISGHEDSETVEFTFATPLKEGSGHLEIEFSGELTDSMKGFYLSKYEHLGETKHLACTQFEATDARRAFPCWDEPAHKAVFEIDITAEKRFKVLSNAPEKRREAVSSDASLERVFFEPTPVMSTYLVAFVVGELDYIEDRSGDGVKVRVYTSLGNSAQGTFALDIACRTLPFYKEYFGCPYPLAKMDLVAIPDFCAGAMENWGLVTYRETALLVDPKESSASARQRVALVVGHELAHQWFGNLVTMEWWTHLWLNEGFATWIEYLSVDHCCPNFDIWTQFASTDFADALEMDALKSSHPIEVEVGHPDEINEIFDRISYSKGASIIRMMQSYMGAETFMKGLQIYLERHQYTNTKTEQLWEALEQACERQLPVAQIMRTWTSQMGYPVVTVSRGSKADGRTLKFSQKRYLADGTEDSSSLWLIPIILSAVDDASGKPVHKFVLSQREFELTLPTECAVNADQIRLNPLRVGFYRVHYTDAGLFDSLKTNLHALGPIDRLAVQNDAFALSRAGLQPLGDFLNLLPLYAQEKDYTVWADLVSNLHIIHILAEELGEQFVPLYRSVVSRLLEPLYSQLGWEESDDKKHTDQLLRSLVLSLLGRAGHPGVLEEGRRRFQLHCSNETRLTSNLRSSVYGMVMRHGDRTELDQLLALLASADLQEEKVRLQSAMGNAPMHLLPEVHALSMDEKYVRKQDSAFVLLSCGINRESRRRTWAFVKQNWAHFSKTLSGLFLMGRLMNGLIENFASQDMVEDVQAFFAANPNAGCVRPVEQALESVRINIGQKDRDGKALGDWLQKVST